MHINKIDFFSDNYPTKEAYPFNLEIFQNTRNISLNKAITFFVGENGSGKSTLLRAIANKCNIHIWENDNKTRYEKNEYEKILHKYIDVHWNNGEVPGSFFASQIFNQFAKSLDEWASNDAGILKYYGDKSLVSQSHGQCNMSFFKSRYKIKGLYLLDEPENALSPKKQIEFLNLLKQYSRGESQFVIATHSPILLACPDSQIYSFDNSFIQPVNYEDTSHYTIYKNFMNDNTQFIK